MVLSGECKSIDAQLDVLNGCGWFGLGVWGGTACTRGLNPAARLLRQRSILHFQLKRVGVRAGAIKALTT